MDRKEGRNTGASSSAQRNLFDNDHEREKDRRPVVEGIAPREITCSSAMNRTKIPGYDYCMNPYGGCTHGCVYCYASFMCRFTNHRESWGKFLDVKINFPDILAKQLGNRSLQRGKVLLGTVTDAYQPAEAHYGITRSSLNILVDHPLLEVHILTKSDLVRRDIEILHKLAACEVGFTITTMDKSISRVLEPSASSPDLRLEAAGELMKAGIPVWVFVAPLLPGLTDTEASLKTLIDAIHKTGIRKIEFDSLNPYPAVARRLENTYKRNFPGKLPELEGYLHHPDGCRKETAGRIGRLRF